MMETIQQFVPACKLPTLVTLLHAFDIDRPDQQYLQVFLKIPTTSLRLLEEVAVSNHINESISPQAHIYLYDSTFISSILSYIIRICVYFFLAFRSEIPADEKFLWLRGNLVVLVNISSRIRCCDTVAHWKINQHTHNCNLSFEISGRSWLQFHKVELSFPPCLFIICFASSLPDFFRLLLWKFNAMVLVLYFSFASPTVM